MGDLRRIGAGAALFAGLFAVAGRRYHRHERDGRQNMTTNWNSVVDCTNDETCHGI